MSWQTVIAIISIATAGSLVAADAPVEIRAVMDRQVAAWNRGDIDGYMDGYVRSDKLEFVSGAKITRGWQTVRDRYHRKYSTRDAMGTLKFSDIEIRMLRPNIAIVAGRWELLRKNDRPHGSFVLTFRRIPPSRDWRIVHDETS